jgi:hypothetical protein
MKSLEKEPENRYQSAKELHVDLWRVGSFASGAALVMKPYTKRGRLSGNNNTRHVLAA